MPPRSPRPSAVAPRLVFLGATALGLGDRFQSPFSAIFPGVEFFATAADNLLTGRSLKRNDPIAAIDILAIAVATVLAAIVGTMVPTLLAAPLLFLLAALQFGAALAAFTTDEIWLNVIFPVFAVAIAGG